MASRLQSSSTTHSSNKQHGYHGGPSQSSHGKAPPVAPKPKLPTRYHSTSSLKPRPEDSGAGQINPTSGGPKRHGAPPTFPKPSGNFSLQGRQNQQPPPPPPIKPKPNMIHPHIVRDSGYDSFSSTHAKDENVDRGAVLLRRRLQDRCQPEGLSSSLPSDYIRRFRPNDHPTSTGEADTNDTPLFKTICDLNSGPIGDRRSLSDLLAANAFGDDSDEDLSSSDESSNEKESGPDSASLIGCSHSTHARGRCETGSLYDNSSSSLEEEEGENDRRDGYHDIAPLRRYHSDLTEMSPICNSLESLATLEDTDGKRERSTTVDTDSEMAWFSKDGKVQECWLDDSMLRRRRTMTVHKDPVLQVVEEMCSSERAYVARLHLLAKVYLVKIRRQNELWNLFPDDVIRRMFPNVESIYTLHHDNILPQLEERLDNWENCKRIGDVIEKFSPFLKLYTGYVTQVDEAVELVTRWRERSTPFSVLLRSVEDRPDSGRLSIQHHMLEPVQRLPRYKLLLEQYIKRLPPDSDDFESAKRALGLISASSLHNNNTIRKMENMKQLLMINNDIHGSVNLLDSSREFIKEGRLMKVSARFGNSVEYERQIFLFSDMLLLCATKSLILYALKGRLDLERMKVLDSENMNSGFVLKCPKRVIEFRCKDVAEKQGWCKVLRNTIQAYEAKLAKETGREYLKSETKDVGDEAPILVRKTAATMCMQCGQSFGKFKRKYNCLACGILVCFKCSTKRTPLPYSNMKLSKVCDKCFLTIQKIQKKQGRLSTSNKIPVAADSPSLMSGFVSVSNNRKRTWNKLWLSLHDDSSLYVYKARKDIAAKTVITLKGCYVFPEKGVDPKVPYVFTLTEPCGEDTAHHDYGRAII